MTQPVLVDTAAAAQALPDSPDDSRLFAKWARRRGLEPAGHERRGRSTVALWDVEAVLRLSATQARHAVTNPADLPTDRHDGTVNASGRGLPITREAAGHHRPAGTQTPARQTGDAPGPGTGAPCVGD